MAVVGIKPGAFRILKLYANYQKMLFVTNWPVTNSIVV